MRTYTEELLREAVKASVSYAGVLRHLGIKQAGGSQSHVTKMVARFEIDTSHFSGQGHRRGKTDPKKKFWKDVLLLGKATDSRVKRPLLLRTMLEYGFTYICSECSIGPEWNGKKLVLEIDHLNGDFWDNRPENLRFLCPNCHSQQVETNRPHRYKEVKYEVKV